MQPLTKQSLLSLLQTQQPPCLSLYQPTHRHHPDNQQDRGRFRNLVRHLEESLRQKYPSRDIAALLEPFRDLADNSLFWNHTRDGLAVLACPGNLSLFTLQRSVPELAVVADRFHLKPLLRYVQSADRFQVLALSRDRIRFFEGNRYALDEEALPSDFPTQLEQVVEPPAATPGVSIASSNAGVGSPKIVLGHGEGQADLDTEKFFRAVDRAVVERFSKATGLPLILAGLTENQAVFRRVSQNPLLVESGVNSNPWAISVDELQRRVWQVMEPHYRSRLQTLKDNYHAAQVRQSATADLADAARAALAGRVGTLLIEAEKVLPGIIDRTTGAIRFGELNSPEIGDLLDDLAELVLTTGGEVVVVPSERMPTTTGLAAIYRY